MIYRLKKYIQIPLHRRHTHCTVCELNRQVKAREKTLRRENLSLKAKLSERYRNFFMVGKSQAMLEVQQLIQNVAPSKASVLLLGESGTGKLCEAFTYVKLPTQFHSM